MVEQIASALDGFRIELPSWGFADTGTRFGKFLEPTAAKTIDEKFADAAQVHRFTGCCPALALHVLWDIPAGTPPGNIRTLADEHGVRAGSVNAFQTSSRGASNTRVMTNSRTVD